MRKMLMTFFVLAILAPGAWAQQGQNLMPEGILRKIQSAVKADRVDVTFVLDLLDSVRSGVAEMKQEHPSEILQSMLFLYEGLVSEAAKNPQQVLAGDAFEAKDADVLKQLCEEINRPMKTGWGKTISVSDYITEHMNEARQAWTAAEPVNRLDAFADLLIDNAGFPFPPMTDAELKAVNQILKNIEKVRSGLATSKQEKDIAVLMSFLNLYEKLAEKFADNSDIASRFVAKNPQVVKALAREMQKPMKVGWREGKTIVMGQYIEEHLQGASDEWFSSESADELFAFNRDILYGIQ